MVGSERTMPQASDGRAGAWCRRRHRQPPARCRAVVLAAAAGGNGLR